VKSDLANVGATIFFSPLPETVGYVADDSASEESSQWD
jgi:hypothetical protein